MSKNVRTGCHGQLDKDKPLSNGDRIRAMPDEELAIEFSASICDKVEECKYDDAKCTVCKLKWLKKEV